MPAHAGLRIPLWLYSIIAAIEKLPQGFLYINFGVYMVTYEQTDQNAGQQKEGLPKTEAQNDDAEKQGDQNAYYFSAMVVPQICKELYQVHKNPPILLSPAAKIMPRRRGKTP